MAVIDKFKYDQTDNALTTAYQEYTFKQSVKGCVLYNKASAGESTIQISINGTDENASVDPGDHVRIGNLVNTSLYKVSLKYTVVGGSGAPNYQLMSSEK